MSEPVPMAIRHSFTCWRQTGRLSVVRRVVREPVASLSRDHVEDGALDIAVLCGYAHGLHLHFLNHVDAGLGARDPGAGAREVRAVDQEQVFVTARAEG